MVPVAGPEKLAAGGTPDEESGNTGAGGVKPKPPGIPSPPYPPCWGNPVAITFD